MKEIGWLIFFMLVIILVLLKVSAHWQAQCEAKGGEYHYQYKSQPLCLKKGSTISLD